MAKNEVTSARIARISAKGLAHPEQLTLCEIAEVCGSNLAQAVDSGEINTKEFIAGFLAAQVIATKDSATPKKRRRRRRKNAGGRPKGSKNKAKK